MREVFLENLPMIKVGINKGKINWNDCINLIVAFNYDDIKGEVKIIEYKKDIQRLKLNYKGLYFEIKTCNFIRCKLNAMINNITVSEDSKWMIEYFQNHGDAKLYTKASEKRIIPICPICGKIKKEGIGLADLYHYKSIGCPCGDGQSYPNKFMYSILKQFKIEFQTEYSPDWISPKRYDFYFELNGKKYIIEMDGSWHYTYNYRNKQTAKQSQSIDNIKDLKASQQGINVIRINSEKSNIEYLKNNINNSILAKLFNLSQINWIECGKVALSNRVKETCDLKRDNQDITTSEIAEIVGISRKTAIDYLNKGNELGWCSYDGKQEMIKTGGNHDNNRGKKIEIFKDNISLGIFKSCAELARQSKYKFGVNFSAMCISLVAIGKQKAHKGFTFKYIANN